MTTSKLGEYRVRALSVAGAVALAIGGFTLTTNPPGVALANDAAADPLAGNPTFDPFGAEPNSVRQGASAETAADLFADPPVNARSNSDPFGGDANPGGGTPGTNAAGDKTATKVWRKPDRQDAVQKVIQDSSFSPSEKNILRQLQVQTTFQYLDTPLVDVMEDIKLRHSIPILFDIHGLDSEEVAADSPATIALEGVSLESALNLLLMGHNLTYLLEDDVLLITTRNVASNHKQIRVYNSMPSETAGELVPVLQKLTGEDGALVVAAQNRLIVKDSFRGQIRIMKLLAALTD